MDQCARTHAEASLHAGRRCPLCAVNCSLLVFIAEVRSLNFQCKSITALQPVSSESLSPTLEDFIVNSGGTCPQPLTIYCIIHQSRLHTSALHSGTVTALFRALSFGSWFCRTVCVGLHGSVTSPPTRKSLIWPTCEGKICD